MTLVQRGTKRIYTLQEECPQQIIQDMVLISQWYLKKKNR